MSNELDPTRSWYAPLEREKAPVPKKKRKGLSSGWRIALAGLLLLCLIVGTSLAFAGRGEDAAVVPYDPGFPMLPEGESELPLNPRDFFRNYYTKTDREDEIRIPRVEQLPEFTLEFAEPGEELSLQELYEACAESIVAITGYPDGSLGYYWGSGIVLSEDGLILTNAHVLEDCDSARVTLADDSVYEARLVGADAVSDIAVLKIEAEGLRPAVFGDSARLVVGEHVAAIGNPIGETFRYTLTDGIVSALNRGVNYNGRSNNAIQTTTAINEGSSGGALLNMYGQVVGVTNMKMVSVTSSIEGMSLAVPSATVQAVVNTLVRYGNVRGKTAVGLTVGTIPAAAMEQYDYPEGLYVTEVAKGSDAEKKGIREGDVILAVNGLPATDTQVILDAKADLDVGDTLTFTVWRDGESFDVDVALMKYNEIY